jgi:hypothetical protein
VPIPVCDDRIAIAESRFRFFSARCSSGDRAGGRTPDSESNSESDFSAVPGCYSGEVFFAAVMLDFSGRISVSYQRHAAILAVIE